jgi:peptidoglycan/LPS O-acetylase OafA/YrhL
MWEFGQRPPPIGTWIVGVSICFSAGSYAYLFRERIPMRWWIAALCVAALVILPTKEVLMVVIPCLAYLTVFAAVKLPFRKFDRRMDFSYGLYIYAYPIQQMLTMYRINAFGLAAYMGSALVISVAFAAASWFSVEKPCLSLKNLALGRLVAGRPTTRADIS